MSELPLRLREQALEWRELDGEIVAFDRLAGDYFAVTGSGALLWRRLCDGATRPGLVEALVERYDVGRERAARDVDAFVDGLARRGLFETP